MTRLYYAIPTSSRAEEVYFAVRAGYEIILLVISSFKFRKHALGAKRLTDVVMFHIAHMTFCVLAAAKESWTVYILFEYAHEGALDCYYEGISSITAAPQHVALAVSLALFFNHWYVHFEKRNKTSDKQFLSTNFTCYKLHASIFLLVLFSGSALTLLLRSIGEIAAGEILDTP